MMPYRELRGGRLAETEIQLNPSTQEDKVLSHLNQGYRFSKAQQILRLLKDQDELNKRFRECSLLDKDEEDGGHQQSGDPDSWSLEEEQRSEGGSSDESQHEAERRAARLVPLRKYPNGLDPGRCKTSMGFYNEAEVTEIPYDTDSDANVAGIDSAAATSRGGLHPVLSARQPSQQSYGAGTNSANNSVNNARLRVYRLKMEEGDVNVKELALPEDCVVQSAGSTRPKTSLSQSSPRSRYYRQQPHPESRKHQQSHQHQPHHHDNSHNHHQPAYTHHQYQQQRGMGETRQSIISRLDPQHPMAVRPFCDNMVAPHEEVVRGMSHHASHPSTPRGTPRSSGNGQYLRQTEVTLFDMAPKEPARSKHTVGGGSSMARSTSFAEHGSKGTTRVMQTTRTLLSVDSSPLLAVHEDPGSSRRSKSKRFKKRVGEMSRGTASTSMHVISDSAQTLAVMKLPPLETAVTKTGSGRDLVCVVGKD